MHLIEMPNDVEHDRIALSEVIVIRRGPYRVKDNRIRLPGSEFHNINALANRGIDHVCPAKAWIWSPIRVPLEARFDKCA